MSERQIPVSYIYTFVKPYNASLNTVENTQLSKRIIQDTSKKDINTSISKRIIPVDTTNDIDSRKEINSKKIELLKRLYGF